MNNNRKNSRNHKKEMKTWQKRLIDGLVLIFSVLVVISLIYGLDSILNDVDALSLHGNVFTWPFQKEVQVENPIGVFGVAVGYAFSYLLGYYFSFIGFVLLAIMSLLNFLEPAKKRNYHKFYLILIASFLLQVILVKGLRDYSHSVLPRAIWAGLSAIFSNFGASLLIILGIVLCLILIFEYERLKLWFSKVRDSISENRKKASLKKKKDKLTINEKEVHPPVIPVIQNHIANMPKEETAYPKKEEIPEPELISPIIEVFGPPSSMDKPPYVIPSVEDFLESPVKLSERDRKEIENQILATSQILKNKLAEFGIEAEVRNVNIGPIITQYELEPAKGVKVNRFTSLADDLALAIKAKSIRVQAPIPGRGLIGIEIPNMTRDMIYLKDLLLSEEMKAIDSKLAFGLGKDIAGRPVVSDLAKMPHLLIAGATGSGKSVCINTIIMSFLFRTTPEDLRLILIDPKRVELTGYNDLPHLLGSVVTDSESALENLYWAVKEMERRYELLHDAGVRDINAYNEKATQEGELKKLPYIVIIIDEFADLILTSGKDIELPITRLAQMARAVGIHLILATQRPSIKVITGIIKANFSARIAFQVSSKVDSRVILDQIGAERLLGNGDMLFLPPGKAQPERIHGAFVSDKEIARVCEFLKTQPKPEDDFVLPIQSSEEMGNFEYDDELFPEAAKLVVRANTASVSMLQRHFRIGYARAGRLIDLLERAHIIGPHMGSKSREVLATTEDLIRRGIIRDE
ncbi:DNA translocase FtsK [Candidatus Syntrophosphaera thermopropionivorans]|uniref:DNA translocase FtsK n=1 Tax=Candidatus Syntrophosphaera thermopropionivorans TaxID=2593015 RepID=A0AC61QJM2_9BACT|nr:DNA translocase FtsK [Candidatus Syntrophosphaera thermopropionivorans]TDF73375.1 DNA translocase FtsK [Candidatus Syntrophosphaera thermopropionivorans]